MAEVTIEGSRYTPSDKLGRGVRAKVELTPEIRRLIANGSVIIVDQVVDLGVQELVAEDTGGPYEQLPEVSESSYGPGSTPLEPVTVDPAGVKPPPRNGATADWQAWVSANVPGANIEGRTRDELIAMWQEFDGE